MQFFAGVIWFVHWIIRFGLILGVPVVFVRRTWDSSLVRIWFVGLASAFLSQRLFFSDCPLTILEVVLRDGFMLSESVNRSQTLKAFIVWGVPCPAHTVFILALGCVVFCALVAFRATKGAKRL